MCVQRVMLDFKTSIIVLPCAVILRLLAMNGVFPVLPFGGGYASLLFCVIIGVFAARMMNLHKLK